MKEGEGPGVGGVEGCVRRRLKVRELSGRERSGQSRASGHLPGPTLGPPPGPTSQTFCPRWPALPKCHHKPQKPSCPQAPLTMAAHVGRREAAEGVAPRRVGEAGHGADHGLQVLLLLQAAGVGLGLAWGRRRSCSGRLGRDWTAPRTGRVPGEGAFWALKRPTTPLPCRPPERSSTARERPLRQQTTGKRFWR